MNKFDALIHQLINHEDSAKRSYAFDRLIEEFPDKRETVVEVVFDRGDDPIRKRLILLLAEQDDRRGVQMLKKELDMEFESPKRDFAHWMWLSAYLDYYIKKKNIEVISRFFPLITITDSRIGSKLIEAIKSLKIKPGIPFLIKAAESDQSACHENEYAIFALGEIGGKEVIEPLLKISRNAGAISKRCAKEAIEKVRSRE